LQKRSKLGVLFFWLVEIDLRSMENSIFLNSVLEKMRETDANGNLVAFDIEWRTWNERNKMGGKLMVSKQAKLCMVTDKKKNIVDVLRTETSELPRNRRNPNHYKNRTRNIDRCDGSHPVKIHIDLITKFNGMQVVY
jgi:hypothetical protein